MIETITPSAVSRESYMPSSRHAVTALGSETEKTPLCVKDENQDGHETALGFNSAELSPFYSESWFTTEGARLKERRLRKKGIPSLKNWRFITLTMADRSMPPEVAYQIGKDRLRRYLAKWRKRLGHSFRWLWKLEFHDDEYAHWHLVLEYTKFIPQEVFLEIEKWWGLGRTNIKRINAVDMRYVFKYVAKDLESLPDWVRCYKGRMRVFQTSKGFFTVKKERPAREKKEPRMCMVPHTLATRLDWDAHKALVKESTEHGERFCSVRLTVTFAELHLWQVQQAIIQGRQLAAPGKVNISQQLLERIKHECRKYSGLGKVPDLTRN